MMNAVHPPDEFDGGSVPRRREDLVHEELDGEIVIWDPQATSLYVLNQAAATVWMCLDGSSTIDALARDLGEHFGIPIEQMRLDVFRAVRDFGEQALLEAAAGQAPAQAEPATTAQDGSPAVSSSAKEPPSGPQLLPRTATGCSADALDRMPWEGVVTLRLGEWLVNVRANTHRAADAISGYLAPHVVPPVGGQCQYSVVLQDEEQEAGSVGRPLNVLYRGTCAAIRSQHPAEVLSALAVFLSEHADADEQPLRIRATILAGGDGEAYLLPDALRREAALREHRLADAGLYLAQNALAVLVPGEPAVELRAGSLETDEPVLRSLDPAGAGQIEKRRVPVGRHRIRACVVPGAGEPLSRVRPAQAVRRLAAMAEPVSEEDRRTLFDTISTLVRSTEVYALGGGSPRRALDELLRRRSGLVARHE